MDESKQDEKGVSKAKTGEGSEQLPTRSGAQPGLPEDPPSARDGKSLDLAVERIDTEGVLKEGFAGQEM